MDVEQFYNSLLVRNAFSTTTVEGYRKVLSKFFKEVGTDNPDQSHIENYIAGMRKKNYSYSHIRNSIIALERYAAFIGRPVKLGRMRRPKPIIKDTLTEGEVARMLAATQNSREQAIVALLAYSGIRNKEFCGLKAKDADVSGQMLKILDGKGNKDRIAYISKECVKTISKYLNEYPRKDDAFLITTLVKGNPYQGGDLRKMVKVVAKRAKIKKRVYPHLLRHSLAVNLLARGANIMTIQQILGHSSLQSTLIYAHSIPQKVQNEYSFYVPNYL